MGKLIKVKRISKNLHLLPSTKQKIEKLGYESGFSHGQIVDMAIDELSEKSVLTKAIHVKSMEKIDQITA